MILEFWAQTMIVFVWTASLIYLESVWTLLVEILIPIASLVPSTHKLKKRSV